MKLIHKSQAVADITDQLPVCSITDDVLVLQDDRICLVAQVANVNFDLMNVQQQQAVVQNYANFLNALDINCQILIKIRSGEISVPSFNHCQLQQPLMQRHFYLVFSCQQTAPSRTVWQLKLQAQAVIQHLSKAGLQVTILNDLALIDLLFNCYHPLQGNMPSSGSLDQVACQQLLEATDHLQIDSVYLQTVTVVDYPLLAHPALLADLIDSSDNVDLSIHIERVATPVALSQLNRKIGELESQKRILLKKEQLLTPQVTDPLASAQTLRSKILRNQEALFQVSIYVTVFATSLAELRQLVQQFKTLLSARLMTVSSARFQQLLAFHASLPVGDNTLSIQRNFDTSSLSVTFPFRSLELVHANGIFYGTNSANNSLVVIDRFALVNANSIIFAQSGAGKSYLMKLELLRSFLQGVQLFVIDPENEYQALCQALQGSWLDIGSSQLRYNLNPFELTDGQRHSVTALRDKIETLTQLVSLIVEEITINQKAILKNTLWRLYQVKTPNLVDLYRSLQEQKQTALCWRLQSFLNTPLASLFTATGQLALDNQLTVFGLQQVSATQRPLMMSLLADFVERQTTQSVTKRLLMIDEAWLLLQHQTTKDFCNALVRRARKRYLGVALISQQVADFCDDQTAQAILSQASLRILLRQDSTQLATVANYFNLSDYESQFLGSCQQGEALVMADNQHVLAKITALDNEHPLITTKPADRQ